MRVLRNEFVEEMSPRMWKRLSSYVSLINALLVWVVSTFFFLSFSVIQEKQKITGDKAIRFNILFFKLSHSVHRDLKSIEDQSGSEQPADRMNVSSR